jgi:hypothetical protein
MELVFLGLLETQNSTLGFLFDFLTLPVLKKISSIQHNLTKYIKSKPFLQNFVQTFILSFIFLNNF